MKVLVGMSGGVDSSVCALLLKQQGYQVTGITLSLWDESDASDAAAVCAQLEIPHVVYDFRDVFRTKVVDYFVQQYREGKTPNPCIACNREIKFAKFMEVADQLGCDYIATGHYARLQPLPDGSMGLFKAAIDDKDQSYVLYQATKAQLQRLLLPVGGYSKDAIRSLAKDAGLRVHSKPDSQDICFIPDGDYRSFLHRYTGAKMPAGDFVSSTGTVLGRHSGLWHYTVGQRKGMGLALGAPCYVQSLNPQTNAVHITLNQQDLFASTLTAHTLCWHGTAPTAPLEVQAKIRYAHKATPAVVTPQGDGSAAVCFATSQRAITPGQAVVFYQGDKVLGGGIIG